MRGVVQKLSNTVLGIGTRLVFLQREWRLKAVFVLLKNPEHLLPFVQTFGHQLSLALSGLAVPIMSNHDGLIFDVFDRDKTQDVVDQVLTEAGNFTKLIHEVFEVDLKVPFTWDLKVGENLFEMKEEEVNA